MEDEQGGILHFAAIRGLSLIGGVMNELLPLVSGLIVGLALGLLAPRLRFLTGAIAAVVLGTLATVVSGEFKLSWAYLLIDIPLVAVASVGGLLAGRLVRRQFSGAPPTDG
jgi:uncharacterized membrane protein YccC